MLMAIKLLRVHLQTRAMLQMLRLLRIQQHRIQLRQIHRAPLIAQVRRTVRQAIPIQRRTIRPKMEIQPAVIPLQIAAAARTKLPQAMRRQRVTQPRLPIRRPRTALAPTQHPQIRPPHPRIHRRLPAAPIQLIALRQTPQVPLMLLIQLAAAEEDSSLLLASISTFMKLRFSN